MLKSGKNDMRLSLHQLAVFKSISDNGGVTAAAVAMHMTQPAVSNLLKQLEDYFDNPLTERVGKQVHLTAQGEVVLGIANDVLARIDDGKHQLLSLKSGVAGRISVSVVSTAKYFMPKLLAAFQKQFPNVEVKLHVSNREQVISRLNQNQDDFVIMSQPPVDNRLLIDDFYEDQLVVVASKEFECRDSEINLKDLADENWLIRELGSGTRMVMQKLFKEAGVSPNIKLSLGSNESIKQLVMAGMGISIVSKQSIELESSLGLIIELPVKNFPLKHEWYKVSNKGKANSKLVELFMEFAASHSNLAHFETNL